MTPIKPEWQGMRVSEVATLGVPLLNGVVLIALISLSEATGAQKVGLGLMTGVMAAQAFSTEIFALRYKQTAQYAINSLNVLMGDKPVVNLKDLLGKEEK